jgi:hypothetical protein
VGGSGRSHPIKNSFGIYEEPWLLYKLSIRLDTLHHSPKSASVGGDVKNIDLTLEGPTLKITDCRSAVITCFYNRPFVAIVIYI